MTCRHKSWDDSYSCWFVGACLHEFIVYRKPNVHPTRNYWKKMLILFNWNEESSFSSTFADLLKKSSRKIIDTALLFLPLYMQNTACSLYVAGSLWFLTSYVRSADHLQLEYLSVGLHFRGSSLLHWEIQVLPSVLWWEVSGNPTHLGVPVNSWGLCCCPGAALAGIFSWDTHQVLCVGWWDRQGPG